jgi:putative metalloprotease
MLKLAPVLLALIYGLIMYRFSAARTSKELDAKSTQLADPKLLDRVANLASALDLPRIKVHIYEIAPVNGLAAPDGRIFITRGFYEKYRKGEVTADELSSVIAHELGHVALGHSRRRMIDFSGQNAMRAALGMILSRFLPGIGIYIAGAITSLLAARLSRGDEYEADEYASALLIKAGIGTEPQKSLFEKLEQLTSSNASAKPAWLMSHPKTRDRIAAIEKLESKWATIG